MLTIKQRIFIAKYLETSNCTEAASVTYDVDNRNVAGVIGWENLRKPKISRAIRYALEVGGISDEFLASSLKAIIEAGTGVKATAKSSLEATELVFKLKGYNI